MLLATLVFFLIYINDLIYLINAVSANLFADDTTLNHSGVDLSEIINYFSKVINGLLSYIGTGKIITFAFHFRFSLF